MDGKQLEKSQGAFRHRGSNIGAGVGKEEVNIFKKLVLNEKCGARNGFRTRDLNLGKVALYQLSYSRSGRK